MKLNQTIYVTQLEDCQSFGILDAGFCALLKRYAKYVLCYDASWCHWLSLLTCRKFIWAQDTQNSFTYRQLWNKTCRKEANSKEGSEVTWAFVWTAPASFQLNGFYWKWQLFNLMKWWCTPGPCHSKQRSGVPLSNLHTHARKFFPSKTRQDTQNGSSNGAKIIKICKIK